jgi:hypothetical protein
VRGLFPAGIKPGIPLAEVFDLLDGPDNGG